MIKVLSSAITVTDTATSLNALLEATSQGSSAALTADPTGATTVDILVAAGGENVVIGSASIESITNAELAGGTVPSAGGIVIGAGEQAELKGNEQGGLDTSGIYLITDNAADVNCSVNIWH